MSVPERRLQDGDECDNCGTLLDRDWDGEGFCNVCGAPLPPWQEGGSA